MKLGTTIGDAVALLKRDGWKVTPGDPGYTWEETVTRAVNEQTGKSLDNMRLPRSAVGSYKAEKGGESVWVEARPTASGGEVATVSYLAPWAGRSFERLRQQLLARYGVPATQPKPGSRGRMVWRSGGREGPSLAFEPETDGVHLHLNGGGQSEAAWQALRDRAVAQKMGARTNSF